MMIRNILVPVQAGTELVLQLEAAVHVSGTLNAVIEVVYTHRNISTELIKIPLPEISFGVSYDALEDAERRHAAKVYNQYRTWLDTQGGKSPVSWTKVEGSPEEIIKRKGRLADLIVLCYPDLRITDAKRNFNAAISATGRPCLLINSSVSSSILHRVMVAWDGSQEGSVAVFAAMPLLRAAGQVSVLSMIDSSLHPECNRELIQTLKRHEVKVHEIKTNSLRGVTNIEISKFAKIEQPTLLIAGIQFSRKIRLAAKCENIRKLAQDIGLPIIVAQ